MGIEGYIDSIVKNLNLYRWNIKSKNKSGFTDVNRHSQILFANFLNILYRWNLDITDKEISNYPAIDLADKNLRISVQVTSDTSLSKIRDTIELFEKHGLDSEYDRLIFLFIGEKVKRINQMTATKFKFDLYKDCIYIEDLIKECSAELDIKKLKQLAELLESELGTNSINLSKQKEASLESLKRISKNLLNGFTPPNLIGNFSTNIALEETIEKALASPRKLTFQKQNKSDGSIKNNTIEISEILKLKERTFFIEGFGGMGKTHLLWNFGKKLLETETIPIYISLSNFSNVESIDVFFKTFDLELGLHQISNQSNVLFLLDGWTEFALTQNNRSEHSKLLSLIAGSKIIATGRFITELDVEFEILKLEGFKKSETEKYLNKTPSDEIATFLEYPLFLILFVYLNETISKPYDLLYHFYLKITEKFEDNSKFLNVLSFVAAKIEIEKLDKTWINFERLIYHEANKREIQEWQKLLTSSGIVRNFRDRLEPTHDIYWEWLVGIGLHLNCKEWGNSSLTSMRLRDCLRFSIGCLYDTNLDRFHYDLIQTDINAFSIFYSKANIEKKKEFDSKLMKALESKNNSVAFNAIYSFFLSESEKSINKAKTVTYRLLKEGFYFPNIKEKISNAFLWNHKEEFLGWITEDKPIYFIIEAIQKTKDEKWANWIESKYHQDLIPYSRAIQIYLATSNAFPDWIRNDLTEFIHKHHAYHLKAANQLGRNHELATWLFENYLSILGERNNSDFVHINDIIFSCAISELLERIESSFHTLETKIRELLMYGIREYQPQMAVNIAKSHKFTSPEEINYYDGVDLSSVEEECIRSWMKHPELEIQYFGWQVLAKKLQNQLLDEIEISLPDSFDDMHVCPPLRALGEISDLPRKWEDILVSRVKGNLQPMLTVDLIKAFSKIESIGPISFYKYYIEPNPTFLPTYHLQLFLQSMIDWEKKNGLEFRMNFELQSSTSKLTDWIIFQNLKKISNQDNFIISLINLISTDDTKKQMAEALKDNAYISKYFESAEERQREVAKYFKRSIDESKYDNAFKEMDQCFKEVEMKDLLLLIDFYRKSKNFSKIEGILYRISQRNQEDVENDVYLLLKYYTDKSLDFKEIRILCQISAKLNLDSLFQIFYPYILIKNVSALSILAFAKYFSDLVILNDKYEFYIYSMPRIRQFLARIPIISNIMVLLNRPANI